MRKKIRKTRFQQLHLIITLIAALITTGVCAFTGVGLYNMAVLISAVIIIFYVLGQAVRMYLAHLLKSEETIAEEVLDEQEIIMNDSDDETENVYSDAYAEFDEAER